ncbi:MAG: hypothetical protein IT437_05905 [Phycisphaerales bacterium]|nr:hypothetical protein [Phycisphaerales bacterium]
MRLPYSKVYRAFPELDRFDDGQCRLFVRQATAGSLRRRAAGAGLQLLAAVCGVFAWLLIVGVGQSLLRLLRDGAVRDVLTIVLAAGLVFVPSIAALITRDAWLRRSVRARLVSARCPGCEYSLLGLPVVLGVAVCPECGQELDLERMGLTPKDLIASDGVAEVA